MDMKELLNNKSLKILLAGLLVLIAVLTAWFNLSPKKSSEKIANSDKDKEIFAHTEEQIIKEEQLDGLKFSNISLITKNGYTTFTCDVTNTKEEEINTENVNIDLKDNEGNTVITLLGNIGSSLKPGEVRTITSNAKGDFKNVVSKVIAHRE